MTEGKKLSYIVNDLHKGRYVIGENWKNIHVYIK